MGNLRISEVSLVPARPEQIEKGMIGHVSLVLGGLLKLDGLVLRRTHRGHPALSFPCRRDRQGRDHPYIRPLSDAARRRIEERVFDLLDIGEETP